MVLATGWIGNFARGIRVTLTDGENFRKVLDPVDDLIVNQSGTGAAQHRVRFISAKVYDYELGK